jgi:hypothetical protein
MFVPSEEQMFNDMCARSPILNGQGQLDPNVHPQPLYVFGEEGMQKLLGTYTTTAVDEYDNPVGLIGQAKAALEEAKDAWEKLADRLDFGPQKRANPEDDYLEAIRRASARLRCVVLEAETIQDLLDKGRKREQSRPVSKEARRAAELKIVKAGGKMVAIGGLKVIRDEAGEKRIEETNELVSDYVNRVIKKYQKRQTAVNE